MSGLRKPDKSINRAREIFMSTAYRYLVFEGGLYRQNVLFDFIEDVGGAVVQKSVIGLDLVVFFAIPPEDEQYAREVASVLKGKIKDAPLLGCEIALVSPTVTRHHTPHPVCDISEYLRRYGAKINMVGLARGVGQRTAQLSGEEKKIIEEHDLAVFVLGNFEYCLLNKKHVLYKDLSIPVIVTGAPHLSSVPHSHSYVGGFGRICHRLKSAEEVSNLNKLVKAVADSLENIRKEMSLDPLSASPILVTQEIERYVEEVSSALAPAPLTLKVDGVRVKLDYDKFVSKIRKVPIGTRKLEEIAEIGRSAISNHILVKILPESLVGSVFSQ